MFAIGMESEPGGELLDKVVKVYVKETFMVEKITNCNLFVKTGQSFVDYIYPRLNKEYGETS